jgi:hypothetical protein
MTDTPCETAFAVWLAQAILARDWPRAHGVLRALTNLYPDFDELHALAEQLADAELRQRKSLSRLIH